MADTVTLKGVTVKKETEIGSTGSGAILCVIDGDEYWIPKKLIHEDSEVYKMDTEGDLIIPEWFADKEEIG